MNTTYQLIPVDGAAETFTADLPAEPDFHQLERIIRPLVSEFFEHVAVLLNGKATDMFVDDEGMIKRLPVNRVATEIYRAAALRREPSRPPETEVAPIGWTGRRRK